MKISEKIKTRRASAGLSQDRAAAIMGLSQSTLSNLEGGIRPTFDHAYLLGLLFDCPWHEFYSAPQLAVRYKPSSIGIAADPAVRSAGR